MISPLNKTVGGGVRLTAFVVPDNPATDRWTRVLLDGELNRMHNHWHVDLDSDGLVDTLTASSDSGRPGLHMLLR